MTASIGLVGSGPVEFHFPTSATLTSTCQLPTRLFEIADRMTVRGGVEFALQSSSCKKITENQMSTQRKRGSRLVISITNLAEKLTALIVIYIDK